MTKNRIELLAPSGNLEILKVAVDTGADSVYLGLKEYSARAGADNFTLDELEEGVDYAHARSAKVFLAVNTLMSDSEFELFYPTIAEAVNIGVDGLIVQDLAVLKKLSSDFPDVIINCSTQMNVFTDMDFKSLSELGFSRVVLPRVGKVFNAFVVIVAAEVILYSGAVGKQHALRDLLLTCKVRLIG